MNSRTCVACGGITYTPNRPKSGNNWICGACWRGYCRTGVPHWLRFLRNQARYERRKELGETVFRDERDYPEVRLSRYSVAPFCEVEGIELRDLELVCQ